MENMNGPPMDEKQELLEWKRRERRAELEDGGTGRKERDGGDIEPNALNKASVMELMTGCVPLVTRTRQPRTRVSFFVPRHVFLANP